MKIVRKTAAALIAASLILSGSAVANAQSFSSGSSSFSSEVMEGSSYGAQEFLDDYKQLHRDKGYTIIEAPELIAEYARKAQNEREVTYLPNGNGLFSDSFDHIFDGYLPKAQRIKHYGHNIRFDRDTTVLTPADEGERVALDIVSDNTYYYIIVINFTERYQG